MQRTARQKTKTKAVCPAGKLRAAGHKSGLPKSEPLSEKSQ